MSDTAQEPKIEPNLDHPTLPLLKKQFPKSSFWLLSFVA